MMFLLVKAIGIGLLLAAPVGPIGLLCLRRSLTLGMAAGLTTGLGAATADAIYAGIAAFALGAAPAHVTGSGWLGAAGGLALIWLGMRDLLTTPPAAGGVETAARRFGAYTGAVLLTLANPATLLTFTAIILGLGLVPDLTSAADRLIFIAGVFAGSGLWWLILSAAGDRLGSRLTPAVLRGITRAAGAAFIAFGIFAIARQLV